MEEKYLALDEVASCNECTGAVPALPAGEQKKPKITKRDKKK